MRGLGRRRGVGGWEGEGGWGAGGRGQDWLRGFRETVGNFGGDTVVRVMTNGDRIEKAILGVRVWI